MLNVDNSFIVADSYLRNIYQVDLTSGATAQLLPFGTASAPAALAYDSTAKLLYWTDVATHTINKYSLLTNSSVVIYRDPANAGKCELMNYPHLTFLLFVRVSHQKEFIDGAVTISSGRLFHPYICDAIANKNVF